MEFVKRAAYRIKSQTNQNHSNKPLNIFCDVCSSDIAFLGCMSFWSPIFESQAGRQMMAALFLSFHLLVSFFFLVLRFVFFRFVFFWLFSKRKPLGIYNIFRAYGLFLLFFTVDILLIASFKWIRFPCCVFLIV